MRQYYIIILLCSLQLMPGCSKKDLAGPQNVTDQSINKWLLNRMEVYYYWNTSLPHNPSFDQEPNVFFNQLKNASDRFSRLYYKKNPQGFDGTLINNFGFDLIAVETSTGFSVSIALVVPGSTAETSGLVRGQYLSGINGQTLTQDNIQSVTESALRQQSIVLQMKQGGTITLPSAYIGEPVVYQQSVIPTGDHKTGYLVIGPFDYFGVYDILNACQYFKAQQIDNLIIDLRYSPGGSVPFSALLTALFAPVKGDQLYTVFKGNANAKTIESTFQNELAKQPEGYSFTMASLLPYQLSLASLYILTTRQTASAAELITNNLKPYVRVTQIGDRTLGKDMASLAIEDERQPPIMTDITIYPMVFKLYNAQGNGDYAQGLIPNYSVYETDNLPLKPLGSTEDPLIRKAMEIITGRVTNRQGITNGSLLNPTGISNRIIFESRSILSKGSDLIFVP